MKSEKKIFRLFQEIEMPLVTIVAEMELCGALVDLEYCEKLKDKYVAKLRAIDTQLDKELCSIKPIMYNCSRIFYITIISTLFKEYSKKNIFQS
jgi:hypothetical protein